MSLNIFQSVKKAIANLDPEEIRQEADRPLRVGLHAGSDLSYRQMEQFFNPVQMSDEKRAQVHGVLVRAGDNERFDVDIYSQDVTAPRDGFYFAPEHGNHTINEILNKRPELSIPLARRIPPFRQPVIQRIITKISKENALFSIATALPDIVPFLSLPWAVGEFASDTAFITANQFRMAFFLAAASDRPIGYREQKNEIAMVLLGAFGWRAIARELVGKIPFGGGLLPKAAIAYAGTRVVGMSMERFYRIGYGFSRDERRAAYEQAFERGKVVASALLAGLRRQPLHASSEQRT